MAALRFTVFLLLLVVHGTIQKSNPASPTYKAAVVELSPVMYTDDPVGTLRTNAKKIIHFIERAASQDADIVAFPELSLNTIDFAERPDLDPWTSLVPDPSQNYRPCTNSSISVNEELKNIACSAAQNGIYVVINVLEKERCSEKNCPGDGVFYFISNVAFDRTGRIVARYRKTHLFDEYGWLNVMESPKHSIFDTDFGVRFGNIICFDIMYEHPWLTQTRELNVTDIIHASGWFNEMPFLGSLQLQSGWAYAEDVNLLSAGYNRIDESYSGTGIYAGRQGIIAAVLSMDDHEELVVAEVKKKFKKSKPTLQLQRNDKYHISFANESHVDRVHVEPNHGRNPLGFKWRYDQLDAFQTKVIATKGSTMQRLNHNEIECKFHVNITELSPPITYRLLALDDVRPFGESIVLGNRVCAIVQCANDRIDSCGHIRTPSATFESIVIKATYVDNHRTTVIPSTLGIDLLPLENWNFNQYKHNDNVHTLISLIKPTKNIVTFGIWGRNYEKDKNDFAFVV